MHHLFLDESGDHSLKVIDPQYPVFVLGGVIVESGHASEEMAAAKGRDPLRSSQPLK